MSSDDANNPHHPVVVLCMGEVLVEFVAADGGAVLLGASATTASSSNKNRPLDEVDAWTCGAGGAPANVAVAIQRLAMVGNKSGSFRSSFCGCIGHDAFGRQLRTVLESEGVDTTHLIDASQLDDSSPSSPTPTTTMVFVADWDDGHKELCFARGADRQLHAKRVVPDQMLQQNVHCFHYGSITLIDEPSASAQRKILDYLLENRKREPRRSRTHPLMTTFDPNYRPTLWTNEETARNVIVDAYRYAHLVKISEEEFAVCTGCTDIQAGIDVVLGQGVELVVVSLGEKGALASNGSFVVESSCVDGIDVVETTGAGDAFMAALITQVLPIFMANDGSLKQITKEQVRSALDFANVVGALTCTRAGAIPALPTKEQVDTFLKKQELRTTLHLTQPQQRAAEVKEDAKTLAGMIDHTFLKPFLSSEDDVARLCQEAKRYNFAMVAVNPALVEESCRHLSGSDVRVGAAIGFPLGQTTTACKAFETEDALQRGATEIDFVVNVRELQLGNETYVREEAKTIVNVCRGWEKKRIICKAILETCYLTRQQIVRGCEICGDAGVDFVKTSTGFGPAGAKADDVRLMRKTVGYDTGVKASGGIRNLSEARAMIEAGASRIGTSNGVAIMEELFREQQEEN